MIWLLNTAQTIDMSLHRYQVTLAYAGVHMTKDRYPSPDAAAAAVEHALALDLSTASEGFPNLFNLLDVDGMYKYMANARFLSEMRHLMANPPRVYREFGKIYEEGLSKPPKGARGARRFVLIEVEGQGK